MNKFEFGRYIFTSYHSQTIWIYGDEDHRQKIAESLERQLNKLRALDFLDHQFSINKRVVKSNRDREDVERICKREALEFYELRGSRVTVSGSKTVVGKLQKLLEQRKFIFSHHKSKLGYDSHYSNQDCGICFTPPEDRKYVVTTNCLKNKNCQRMFCQDCIQQLFEQVPPPFPMKCPSCESVLFLSDILKWASNSVLRKVIEVAVRKFEESNSESILSCPKPCCEQLLAFSTVKKGDLGGSFVFCDECVTTYCLDCSKTLKKPVEIHEDESCEDFQSGTPNIAKAHVNIIREKIMNLLCPKCEAPFGGFDGCAALTCGSCQCNFCALCLEDCGSNAHPHVLQCKWNSGRSYFVNSTILAEANKQVRIRKLEQYLTKLSPEESQRVLNLLCKDLIDLKINLSEIQVKVPEVATESFTDTSVKRGVNCVIT